MGLSFLLSCFRNKNEGTRIIAGETIFKKKKPGQVCCQERRYLWLWMWAADSFWGCSNTRPSQSTQSPDPDKVGLFVLREIRSRSLARKHIEHLISNRKIPQIRNALRDPPNVDAATPKKRPIYQMMR